MRLYCCLNPSRRARERATRGRLGQALSSSPGGQREALHRWIVSPALGHARKWPRRWRTARCGSTNTSTFSRMPLGFAGTDVPADSGLQPRSSVRTLNGNAIPCLKPKTVLHICHSRIYRVEGVQKRIDQPASVLDSKFVRLTVNVNWTWRTIPSCLKERGQISRLEGCSGPARTGASFEAASRRLRTRALG
jgi:hypothetical protein